MAQLLTIRWPSYWPLKWPKCGPVTDSTAYIYIYLSLSLFLSLSLSHSVPPSLSLSLYLSLSLSLSLSSVVSPSLSISLSVLSLSLSLSLSLLSLAILQSFSPHLQSYLSQPSQPCNCWVLHKIEMLVYWMLHTPVVWQWQAVWRDQGVFLVSLFSWLLFSMTKLFQYWVVW